MIVRVALHWNGASGFLQQQGGRITREYSAVYLVETNDPRDQAQTLIAAFDGLELPGIGTPYAFANDQDLGAVCDRIDPQRDNGSSLKWQVTLHYATPDRESGEGTDKDGNPSQQPTEWHDDVELIPLTVVRPVERAVYRSGFVGVAATMVPAGKTIVPCNSAMVPFDPPLEREARRSLLRYITRRATYDSNLEATFHRAVNSATITFYFEYQDLTVQIPQYKGQVAYIGGRFAETQDSLGLTQKYWEVKYEILIDWEQGFRVQICDRGLHARALAGDPDGIGGTISPGGDPEGFLRAGHPRLRVLTGGSGVPISEPVLLNGDGQPLVTAGVEVTPVYLTYSTEPELPFDNLGIPLAN